MHKKQLTLTFFLALGLAFSGQAQGIKRQSIGSHAASGYVGSVSIHETAGQAYGTPSYYNDVFGIRPGFQQPESFKIIESKNELQLGVYPNPASYSFTIESEHLLNNTQLQVVDLNGKTVYNSSAEAFRHTKVDCSQWANGTYFISLRDKENTLYSSKLIITK